MEGKYEKFWKKKFIENYTLIYKTKAKEIIHWGRKSNMYIYEIFGKIPQVQLNQNKLDIVSH
jgi:hypothetical protein